MLRLVSINRPGKDSKVVVVPQAGQSMFVTDVESDNVDSLIDTHIVDVNKKALVPLKKASAAY